MKRYLKTHQSVNALLELLHGQRKLLSAMFYARRLSDFRYEDALEHVNSEKNIFQLLDYGVIRAEGDFLELEDSYLRFLEDVLAVNEEISTASVGETVNMLRDAIEYYQKERANPDGQLKYLRNIRRTIRTIGELTIRNVNDLKRNVDDTYKQERNFEIKRMKLEKFLDQIAAITKLIHDTEHLLDPEGHTFAVFPPDERLTAIITDVRLLLRDAFHSLVGHERTIRDYLHIIDAQTLMVKKIRKLKYLRDQMTWEKSTNVCEVLEQRDDLCMEKRHYFLLKPSLSALRNDDSMTFLLADVRRRLRKRHRPTGETVRLTQEQIARRPLIRDFVDTDGVAKAFLASGHDLFNFVLNYRYNAPQSLEEKVEIYTEIIQNHHEELCFTDIWAEDNDISYPLIYPKK